MQQVWKSLAGFVQFLFTDQTCTERRVLRTWKSAFYSWLFEGNYTFFHLALKGRFFFKGEKLHCNPLKICYSANSSIPSASFPVGLQYRLWDTVILVPFTLQSFIAQSSWPYWIWLRSYHMKESRRQWLKRELEDCQHIIHLFRWKYKFFFFFFPQKALWLLIGTFKRERERWKKQNLLPRWH